jgi:drug/metabolite transporter (DMT)-like permease
MQRPRLEAGALALGAAAMWASGTVLGRFVLGRVSAPTMTSLRFTVALPILLTIGVLQGGAGEFQHYRFTDFVPNLLAIALIPGLLALLLYYKGLSRTPASLATLAELTYPVAATLIASAPPPWGFSQPLYGAQVAGTVLLLTVLVLLNWARDRGVRVEEPAPAAAALEVATPTP